MSVPDKLDEIITDLGIFTPPDVKEKVDAKELEGIGEIYERMFTGCCCACGGALQETSLAVIGAPMVDGEREETYVLMLFCGGACLQDMQITGWMQEQYDSIKQQMHFRGGHGGN